MTLLDMVDKEDICTALRALNENNSFISPLLDDYLKSVANTGKTGLPWDLLKSLIISKFDKVLDDWIQLYPSASFPHHYNGPDKQFSELRAILAERLSRFEGVPYTIQRICELLTEPKRHYSRPDSFLRALQKVVLVVSIIDQDGSTVYRSESLNRESMGQDSPSRLSAEDESYDNDDRPDTDVDMSISMIGNASHSIWATPRPPMMFNSPATIKCLKQQAERKNSLLNSTNVSDETPDMDISDDDLELETQKNSAAPNVPPIDQMLRPIGQLEAFVHNLAPASTETSSSVRNASSLLSPLAGSNILSQINIGQKTGLLNFDEISVSGITTSHVREVTLEQDGVVLEELQQDEIDSNKLTWNRTRKRDSTIFMEDSNSTSNENLGEIAVKGSEDSSPRSSDNYDVLQPSPHKISKICSEENIDVTSSSTVSESSVTEQEISIEKTENITLQSNINEVTVQPEEKSKELGSVVEVKENP